MDNPSPSPASSAIRLSAVLLLAFAAAFFLYYGLSTINDPVFGIDFCPYYVAGRLLAGGNTAALVPQAAGGMFVTSTQPFLQEFHLHYFPDSPVATGWIYPAAYAWLFRPFAGLGYSTAARIWLGINVLLSLASIALLAWARPWKGHPHLRGLRVSWLIFIGLTFQPLLDNMWHGNISALILFCFCLSYLLLRHGRHTWAGFVLGLIVPLKLTPALFVIYFLWRRDWKYLAGALVGGLCILLGTFLTAGMPGLTGYAATILAQLKAGGVAAFNNQSISGFLLHVLTRGDVNGWETISVPTWVSITRYLLTLSLAAAVIWVMHRIPEMTADPLAAEDLDLSLLVSLLLLASPITWYHYYVWLYMPLVVAFDFALAGDMGKKSIAVLAVAYGLLVVQGFAPVRDFASLALQDVWLLRFLVSSSSLGAALFTGLILFLRRDISRTRAARLVDTLEEKGIVGPPERGTGVREVLDYGPAAPPKED